MLGAVVDDVLGKDRPTPGNVSSWSAVAVLRETGAEGVAPAPEPPVAVAAVPGSGAGAGTPTTTCSPSARSRARLSPCMFVPGGTPPAARRASATREPAGSR